MEPRLYCDLFSAKMPNNVSDTAEHILSTQLLASLFPRRNTSKVRYFFSMLALVPALFSCGNSVSGTEQPRKSQSPAQPSPTLYLKL